ncbi:54S ribosomal protein L17 mitochondrial [Spathaspora sp. JA1]|nr:54S ribosomal protein L17 mitochondrial [Spathaspora sp. JA1]
MRGVWSSRVPIIRTYSTQTKPVISSTLLLSRNPIITQEPSAFEKQFHKYQNELWRRLMWTFPRWFFFKTGTVAEQKFRKLNKPPIPDNPNVEFPRGRPQLRHNRDLRFKQEVFAPKSYDETKAGDSSVATSGGDAQDLGRKIVPNSRITQADLQKDLSSLERNLSRTLYLVVKEKGSETWKFPNFVVPTANPDEASALHVLAEEGLYNIGGEKINYFNVSKTPCHLFNNLQENKKEYFIKSHILSGIFEPQEESTQFQWLNKEELKDVLPSMYYQDMSHLLSNI